jgi:hypothetical protein
MLQDVKECEKSLDSGHGSMEEISHSEVSVPFSSYTERQHSLFNHELSGYFVYSLASFIVSYPAFCNGIGSPNVYFLKAYEIKSVLSVHVIMVLKFLGCLAI